MLTSRFEHSGLSAVVLASLTLWGCKARSVNLGGGESEGWVGLGVRFAFKKSEAEVDL